MMRAAVTSALKAEQAHAYSTGDHARYETTTVLVAVLTGGSR